MAPSELRINVEVENEKLEKMIYLTRKLKHEVIELKKLGITKRNINKMFKFLLKN